MMGLLTDAEISQERLVTMSRVFTRADRVLAQEDVSCNVVTLPYNNAPAWSDGAKITFNAPQIGNVTSTDDLIKITGLNFHELSHVLFTPRRNTPIVMAVASAGAFKAFNMLEDQRIETLLVAKYTSTRPYFVACIMSYLLRDRGQWAVSFPLIYGRKYLDRKVRAQVEARFKDQRLVADFKRVIDEYRTLAFPRDEKRGTDLVMEFHALLAKMNRQPESDPNGHIHGDRPDAPAVGKPQPHDGLADKAKEQDEQDQVEQGEDDASKALSDAADDEQDDADGAAGDDNTDDAEEGDGGEGDGGGNGEDADDDADADGKSGGDKGTAEQESFGDDADDNSGKSEGNDDDASDGGAAPLGSKGGHGEVKEPPLSDEDFADMLSEAAEQVAQDQSVQEDIKSKQETIVRGDGDTMSVLDTQRHYEQAVPTDTIQTVRRFGRDLKRLRDEVDPGWHRHQSSGRLNVGRAIMGADLDTVWDRWDEGKNDDADIECVITLDYSSSMMSLIKDASLAMWAIKRSLEEIGANVTVIGYSDAATLMYDGKTKVDRTKYRQFGAAGGTYPRHALREALRVLHSSRRKSKFLINITDGAWMGMNNDDSLTRCNANGVITAMLFLVAPGLSQAQAQRITAGVEWREHKVRAVAMGPNDLAQLSYGIVAERLKQR